MTAVVLALDALPRLLGRPPAPANALDALLASGAIGAREHAAGLAYAALRRRWERAERDGERGVAAMTDRAFMALRRRHDALIEAAGFERFMLDRLLLDGEAPLACEVGRVGEALGRTLIMARRGATRD